MEDARQFLLKLKLQVSLPKRMIKLHEIQPCEAYLRKSGVDYFLKNPDKLFTEKPLIRVIVVNNQPFRYYALDGNKRLFVCHKLGIIQIPVEPVPQAEPYSISLGVYASGVCSWRDLEQRVVSDEEYDLLYP